ncbi:MAG: hypothetical protein Q4C34_04000 [Bacteroidales bacterium]|nr:hypothetical protein [Bacteroidales bacterium]
MREIFGVAAPAVCECCGRGLVAGERSVCAHCLAEIDIALPAGSVSDELRERLHPRTAPIVAVSTWAYYTHDSVVGRLIRLGKYDDRPDIIDRLAGLYAAELDRCGVAADVDVLMPVPMHWLKRLIRGYNQTEVLAATLGARLGIPVGDNLRACRLRRRQATLHGTDRHHGADGAFTVSHPDDLAGLHVAVVDDVITTGATVSAAIAALMPAAPRAISVLALAATPLR